MSQGVSQTQKATEFPETCKIHHAFPQANITLAISGGEEIV